MNQIKTSLDGRVFGSAANPGATEAVNTTYNELLSRYQQARQIVLEEIRKGFSDSSLEINLPTSVAVAASFIEAWDALKIPDNQVILIPGWEFYQKESAALMAAITAADKLPFIVNARKEINPTGDWLGCPTHSSYALNDPAVDPVKYINTVVTLNTALMPGNPHHSKIVSDCAGIVGFIKGALQTDNWSLRLHTESHTQARRPHGHKNEVTILMGMVGPGPELKDKLVIDGKLSDLVVPPGMIAIIKGYRTGAESSNILRRYHVRHNTPLPDNKFFPFSKRLLLSASAILNAKPSTEPTFEKIVDLVCETQRHSLAQQKEDDSAALRRLQEFLVPRSFTS